MQKSQSHHVIEDRTQEDQERTDDDEGRGEQELAQNQPAQRWGGGRCLPP